MYTLRLNNTIRLMLITLFTVFLMGVNVISIFAATSYEQYLLLGDFRDLSFVDSDVVLGFIGEDGEIPSDAESRKRELSKIAVRNKGDINFGGYLVNEEGKKQIQEYVASYTRKSEVKQGVGKIGLNFNIDADLENAGKALSGVRELISTISGILVYLICIGITFFTVIDLAYLTFPFLREKCDEIKDSGNRLMVKQNSSTGERKFRWISDDALRANQICTLESGKNVYLTYGSSRIIAIVAVGISVYLLISGDIDIIVNLAINIVSGAIDALSSLGN